LIPEATAQKHYTLPDYKVLIELTLGEWLSPELLQQKNAIGRELLNSLGRRALFCADASEQNYYCKLV
jgi:hypothetical protein